MNEHPHDSLPAFALGALDADEAVQVTQHLSVCPTCRDHADTFSTVVGLLPYATRPRDPPAHVKRQLLALIAGVAAASGAAAVRSRRSLRWMGIAAALSLVLTLALLGITLDTRGRLAEDEQIMLFLAAPQTISRLLNPTALAPAAYGKMYMQPGGTQAMVLVGGLPRPAPGRAYKCWFGSSKGQAWAALLDIDQHGAARLFLDAREPLDESAEVMVTVEPSSDSAQPSGPIVLSAHR